MSKDISLFVLAAGMGSRYGGLKQMEGFGPSGETIIDYSIYDAIRAGFNKVVFVIKPEMEEAFKEVFLSKYEGKVKIEYVFQTLDMVPEWYKVNPEREKPWGTVQATLVAREKLNEPFLIINGDDFYGRETYEISFDFLQSECSENLYFLPAYKLKNVLSDNGGVKRGHCKVENGLLNQIQELYEVKRNGNGRITGDTLGGDKVDLMDEDLMSMNMFAVHPSIFSRLEEMFDKFLENKLDELTGEYLLSTFLNDVTKTGQIGIKVKKHNAEWFGVTYKEDGPIVREKLSKLVKNGVYPSPLAI